MSFLIFDDGKFLWLRSESGPDYYLGSSASSEPLTSLLGAVQLALVQRSVASVASSSARTETPVADSGAVPSTEKPEGLNLDWAEVSKLSFELQDTLRRMAIQRMELQIKTLQHESMKARLEDVTREVDRLRGLLGK